MIQDLFTMVDYNNDEDQASNLKEVEWNDDGDGGYGDNSEVENDSSDSSIKLSLNYIKKQTNKKFRRGILKWYHLVPCTLDVP